MIFYMRVVVLDAFELSHLQLHLRVCEDKFSNEGYAAARNPLIRRKIRVSRR